MIVTSTQPSTTSDTAASAASAAIPALSECLFSRGEQPLLKQYGAAPVLALSPESRASMMDNAPDDVLSRQTSQFIKISELHRSIDQTVTRLGSAALLRDMLHPPTRLDEVLERQECIRELRSNPVLLHGLEQRLQRLETNFFRAFSTEECVLRYFAPDLADRSGEEPSLWQFAKEAFYSWFNTKRLVMQQVRAIGETLDAFAGDVPAQSPLLNRHLAAVHRARTSTERALFDGKVYRTPFSVEAPGNVPWYVPAFSVHGRFFSMEEVATGIVSSVIIFVAIDSTAKFGDSAASLFSSIFGLSQITYSIARNYFVGRRTLKPLRDRIDGNSDLHRALDSIGEIDALISLAKLPDRFGARGSFPRLSEGERYRCQARALHNPTLVLNGESVPNDLCLNGGRVQVYTGPNSGGKTTFATAILQNQILAQLGTAVAAADAEMTIADQILYQGPVFESLGTEGRFGSELKATRELFMRVTPRSLVVLDEVGDGTIAEERSDIARGILWGLSKIGCGTVEVTHNTDLARRISSEGFAEPLQLEFRDGQPTFKVVPGISSASHADRIARQVGFGPEDIVKLLREKGCE